MAVDGRQDKSFHGGFSNSLRKIKSLIGEMNMLSYLWIKNGDDKLDIDWNNCLKFYL